MLPGFIFLVVSTNSKQFNESRVNFESAATIMRAPRLIPSETSNGMFRFPGSLLYIGDLKGGEPNGKGTVYDLSTRLAVYKGEFTKGVYNGRGERYENGKLVEEGTFVNGVLTSGIRHMPNGLLRCGTFDRGELSGMGRLVFPNGFFLSGYFPLGAVEKAPYLAAIPSAKQARNVEIGAMPLSGTSFFFDQGVFICVSGSSGYLFYYNGDVFVGEVMGTTPRNGLMFKFCGEMFIEMTVGSVLPDLLRKKPKIHVEDNYKYFEMV